MKNQNMNEKRCEIDTKQWMQLSELNFKEKMKQF